MTDRGEGGRDAGSETGSRDAGGVPDPNLPGPYMYRELDDTIATVAASGDTDVAVHCAYPTSGPRPGPYPVIVIAHGLALDPSEYYGYLERLASFGYVALTVNFPSSLASPSDPNNAADLLAGLDWATGSSTVGAVADVMMSGMTGHSEGGKDALYAATLDTRVKAAVVLDPVDSAGGMTCSAPGCVTVASLMPSLHIPTGFLGETTDSTGGVGGMPCAPAAENFMTIYARTNSPSFEVTVTGADHMDFLDDPATCGLVCSLCTAGTASNATVNGMAHAYVAAFYERYIRGDMAYDSYLTGAEAQARYVITGEATITSK
jgi:pimeloyl-ACP methyl ester carboxylesterase